MVLTMDSQDKPLASGRRVVVIVGRPNVGKSTLFNRILGRRLAIVHPQSGVTRDRLSHECEWSGQRFDLVDTGGVSSLDGAETQDGMTSGIHRQVEAAMEEACAAILVVDVEKGIAPLDEEVVLRLRRRGIPVIVAANKADTAARDADTADFAGFGFPVFPVSAIHGLGMEELLNAMVKALPGSSYKTAITDLRVVVVGRPNVGKSSYINKLLGSERVIVSSVPGTTRDSIEIPFQIKTGDRVRNFVLVDTAGLRRSGKIDSSVERFGRFRAESAIARSDLAVLLMDAVQGPTEQDKKIAATIYENGKGCLIVVNKWDLAEKTSPRAYEAALKKALPFLAHCPVVFISAKTGSNVQQTIAQIETIAEQIRQTLPTGVLNRTILQAVERVHPPMVKGKRLKIFYATQSGTAPVRVKIFVNDPKWVKADYTEYLIGVLRKNFKLGGAPVLIQYQARRRDTTGKYGRKKA